MARVLLLPGSRWQVPLARKVRAMGHELLLASPEDAPPCSEFASTFLRSDIFDVDAIEAFARRERADAVVSDECDIAMPVVAELGARLGLRTLSREAAALFTDKRLMRGLCDKLGIPSPEWRACRTPDEAVSMLRELGRPIVLKPVDGTASRGVFTASTPDEVRAFFPRSLSFSRRAPLVIAERRVEGPEFTVDGLRGPDGHVTLAVSAKRHFAHNPNVARELLFSWSRDGLDYGGLMRANDALVLGSPLAFGLTHAEWRWEAGRFYLMEIGARGGGNMISSTIAPHMSGVDSLAWLVDTSLGRRAPQPQANPSFRGRAAMLSFLDLPTGGRVRRASGLEEARAVPGVARVEVDVAEGEVARACGSDSERAGFCVVLAESVAEARKAACEVGRLVRVEVGP